MRRSLFTILGLWVLMGLGTGCAIHYFDEDTGTEHLWGFGHLKMKAQPSTNEVVRAVVTGVETLGVNLSVGDEHKGIGVGYDNRQKAVIMEDTSVSLEWPEGTVSWRPSLFHARFGATPPWITNINEKLSIRKSLKEINHEEK